MGILRQIIFLISFLLTFWASGWAFTPAEERQILKDIAEIKATLRIFMEQTNKRFEDMNKRFEDMNKRFEEMLTYMNKRFEEMDHRFDQLITFLWIMTGIFVTMVAAVIGFALWDRRTIVSRARDEALEKVLIVLRDYAREEPRLAEILKRYGLAS